jgi:multidrug efflux system membrane fusion protein
MESQCLIDWASLTRKFIRNGPVNNNIRFALMFFLAIAVWFGSGLIKTSDELVSASNVTESYTKVQVSNSSQRLFSRTLTMRARTEPNRAVHVLAQLSGKVSAILAEEGSSIDQGQGICQIDAEDRHLRLKQAEAALENATIAYRGALKLKSGGYQSELAISQAKAALAAAKTNRKRAQIDTENLQVKAPFAGIVESRPVEIGDFITPGQRCATVVELSPLKVEALATEAEIGNLALNAPAEVVIAGQTYSGARLSFLAYQANIATKGYRVEALMDNPGQLLRAGVSAQLNVKLAPVQAHLIPASSILLGDRGNSIVKVLLADQTVASMQIATIGESRDGIWVTGLPEEVLLVTVGQNYIIDGERVEPAFSISLEQ